MAFSSETTVERASERCTTITRHPGYQTCYVLVETESTVAVSNLVGCEKHTREGAGSVDTVRWTWLRHRVTLSTGVRVYVTLCEERIVRRERGDQSSLLPCEEDRGRCEFVPERRNA